MRHYSPNSPEAQARLVVAALLADGSLDKSEIESMEKHAVGSQLGLSAAAFDRVLEDFCNDLNITALHHNGGQLRLSRETTQLLLADISEPLLQLRLLALMIELICADGQLSRDEKALIAQVMRSWGEQLASSV